MGSPNVAPPKSHDSKKKQVITWMGIMSIFGSDMDAFYIKFDGEEWV